MEKATIIAEFNNISADLIQTVKGFDSANYNEIPFEGSWTAGQVTQHIILANEGFAHALNGEVKDTDRAIDELIVQLKTILLNYEHKMHSPDFILPELKEYDQEAQLLKISTIQEEVAKAIHDLDLSKTCMAMELPGLGHVTRLEAIYFVIYHTQRHTHQLKEIDQFQKRA